MLHHGDKFTLRFDAILSDSSGGMVEHDLLRDSCATVSAKCWQML